MEYSLNEWWTERIQAACEVCDVNIYGSFHFNGETKCKMSINVIGGQPETSCPLYFLLTWVLNFFIYAVLLILLCPLILHSPVSLNYLLASRLYPNAPKWQYHPKNTGWKVLTELNNAHGHSITVCPKCGSNIITKTKEHIHRQHSYTWTISRYFALYLVSTSNNQKCWIRT